MCGRERAGCAREGSSRLDCIPLSDIPVRALLGAATARHARRKQKHSKHAASTYPLKDVHYHPRKHL
jgi:hypothetical protein